MIDQIILSPESKLRVDLHGEIAAILKLAQSAKTPPAVADRAEQLVMVAGACNRWYLPLWSGAA